MHFEMSSNGNNLQITNSLLTNHDLSNYVTLVDNTIEEENKPKISLNARMLFLSEKNHKIKVLSFKQLETYPVWNGCIRINTISW